MTAQTIERTLPFDEIGIDAEYYGVRIAGVNENEGIFAFTHDRRRALAAANRYARQIRRRKFTVDAEYAPAWVQFTGAADEWIASSCAPDAENATAVIEFDWNHADD